MNEADQATWWFENREFIANDLIAASKSGALGQASIARRTKKLSRIQKATTSKPKKLEPTR